MKEMIINGLKYTAQEEPKKANGSFYEDLIGEYCIIRSYGAGVFFGVVEAIEDNYAVKLSAARRIHYWDDHTAASCSDLALYGITEKSNSSKNSRVCAEIDSHIVLQVVEIIKCSKAAIKNLKSFRVWTEGDE